MAKFADVLGAEPDISLCNSMAREVVSLPLPRHPIVGTQIISIEQSWHCGNLYEISQECPSHSNGLRLGSLPNSIPAGVYHGIVPMTSQTIPNVGCYWRYHPLNNPISSRLLRPHVDQWLGHSVNDKLQPCVYGCSHSPCVSPLKVSIQQYSVWY